MLILDMTHCINTFIRDREDVTGKKVFASGTD